MRNKLKWTDVGRMMNEMALLFIKYQENIYFQFVM